MFHILCNFAQVSLFAQFCTGFKNYKKIAKVSKCAHFSTGFKLCANFAQVSYFVHCKKMQQQNLTINHVFPTLKWIT